MLVSGCLHFGVTSGDKTNVEYLASSDCDLVFIDEEFYKVGFAFAVQDGWPLKRHLDRA